MLCWSFRCDWILERGTRRSQACVSFMWLTHCQLHRKYQYWNIHKSAVFDWHIVNYTGNTKIEIYTSQVLDNRPIITCKNRGVKRRSIKRHGISSLPFTLERNIACKHHFQNTAVFRSSANDSAETCGECPHYAKTAVFHAELEKPLSRAGFFWRCFEWL